MTRDREQTIERICQEALERPTGEREAFLRTACAGDEPLRRDVERLLAYEGATSGFLSKPAFVAAGTNASVREAMLRTGDHIGSYRIEASLGAGGMGEVYRARDATLGREVAIKVLPAVFSSDWERLARFEREARVLAALNHPNIATIHGVERIDGAGLQATVHALVLELVEGETLQERLQLGAGRRALPRAEALAIARQIADALEAAHEKGLVHRDLKPANVKIRPDGVVKVLDFGLAKASGTRGARDALIQSPTITVGGTGEGVLLGTVAYMSPEQARGQVVDKRADLWAFGCVLYEMLTGRAAFDGATVSDTIVAILDRDVDWSALPSSTPANIRRVLERCLAKDSARRLRDIADARLELEETKGTETHAIAPAHSIRFLATLIVAGTLLTGAGTLAGLWWSTTNRGGSEPNVVRFSEPMHTPNRSFPNIALSPDGQHIVYATGQGLYLRALTDSAARLIPGTEGPSETYSTSSPAFSPDGQSIAFFSGGASTGGAIKSIALRGGAVETLLALDFPPCGMHWSTTGIVFSRCFGQGRPGILRVSPAGGREELIVPSGEEFFHGPQMLPGEQAILFTVASGVDADRWDAARIVVQSLTSGERKTLITGGSDARYLSSGVIVYAIGTTVWAIPFDVRRLEVTGRAVPVADGVLRANGIMTGAAAFAASSTSALTYISEPAVLYDIVSIDREGRSRRLGFPPGAYRVPRVSPDGAHVAVGTEDGNDINISIGELDGGGRLRRLTFGGKNRFPLWSHDSERVTYQSDREGDGGIFWQRADGTTRPERLTTPEPGTSHVPEAWSPSGDHLLFRVIRQSGYSLSIYARSTRQATPFRDVASPIPPNAVFSPDGRWVSYDVREADKFLVFVEPFPPTGTKYQVVECITPIWSRNGRELFCFHGNGVLQAVNIFTDPVPTFGAPRDLWQRKLTLGDGPGGNHRDIDPTPDGRFVGIAHAPTAFAATPMLNVVLNWQRELRQRLSAAN